MPTILLQILIILLFPWAAKRICRAKALQTWLSPVVLCYALGIVLGNLPFISLDLALASQFTEISIVLAIPLLLFSTDLRAILAQARPVLISFGLCVFSGLIATALAAFFLQQQEPDSWRIAGMLVGIYTGGTPNMQAIGLALEAPQETIVLLNAADMLCGGVVLIFLTSVAQQLLGKLLPAFQGEKGTMEDLTAGPTLLRNWRHIVLATGLSAAIVGLSLGASYLLAGNTSATVLIILLLTSLSILASLAPGIRRWKDTFETGEYFLLIFCVALGMLANFQELMTQGGGLVLFTALALGGTSLLHLLLAYLFRIDRDTFMITFTAAIYGPAFIGQIAATIGNKGLVFAGIATGLLGYAIGNYLGISIAYFLRWAL